MWAVYVAALVITPLVLMWRGHVRRSRRRAALAASRTKRVSGLLPTFLPAETDPAALARMFNDDRFVSIAGALPTRELAALRAEAEANLPKMTHSFLPGHKKGYTLSYQRIEEGAPHCLAFYHSPRVQEWIAAVVGTRVFVTPDQDQSSLSVLCYQDPGDHINWHYDHNFYRGRHFTVLLSLANESADGGLSACRLVRRAAEGVEEVLPMPPNTLVVFEGVKVLHKATQTAAGDRRILLSMTYCADPRTRPLHEAARRVKDTAFHGLQALWD